MLRRFLQEVRHDAVALLSGIVSVILMALAAIFSFSLPPWVFWPAAYVCLLVAAYRVWHRAYQDYLKERQRCEALETSLAGDSLEAERERRLCECLGTVTSRGLTWLRQLVEAGQVPTQETPGGLDPLRLERSGVIRRDYEGYWILNRLFAPALAKVIERSH